MGDGGTSGAASSRLTETLLAAYTAGTLSEPFAVLVASHLQLTAVHRVRRAYGEIIPQHEPWPRQPMPGLHLITAFMPLALRYYVSRHLGLFEWRTILPGIKRCLIARDARGEASFLRCRPGSAIPSHTHAGLEAVLVLQGAFSDHNGHYAVGDMAVADGTIEHRPVADHPLECIIFMVLEAPVRLTGPFGRVIQRIFGA
ncbi:MAG TPA: cupin domain-containing protein [Xanthobacteraceae bacterium]